MSAVRTVANYGELISDSELNVEAADAIAGALSDGAEVVAYLPEWLATEKAIAGYGGCDRVAAGALEHETDRAYLVSTSDGEDWLPKSQIHVFESAPDAAIVAPDAREDETEGE